ncbi:MAG: PAS domain S-box protein, partial [Thermoanaerobaculia bacterium]|nr:PAS domain S-box protein [Thermoanaerobaculia bacterium]
MDRSHGRVQLLARGLERLARLPRPAAAVGVALAISLLFALHYLVLLLAIERQPHRQQRWRPLALERRLSWATLGLVVTGLYLYFPAIASFFAPETYPIAVPSVCLYLVLDAYATLRLAYTWRAARSPRWRSCYALLAAAFLLVFADDLALALFLTGDRATGGWGTPRSLLSSLPFVLIVIAARGRHLRFDPEPRHPATGDRPEESLPGPLGQTLTFILVFPMIHFGVARSAFFAATERPRENLILWWIGLLGVLAITQYRFLARKIADLRRERQRSERALYQLGRELALQTERRQLSQAMRASDERFRKAFRACPDVMTVSRLSDGRFTDVNPSCQRLFGWTPAEWVGRTSSELGVWVHPEDRAQLLEQLRERGSVQDFEGELRRKDGSTDIGLLSATLLELDGEMHFFSVTHSINAHRRGARAWQRLLTELEDDDGETARALARWRAA